MLPRISSHLVTKSVLTPSVVVPVYLHTITVHFYYVQVKENTAKSH